MRRRRSKVIDPSISASPTITRKGSSRSKILTSPNIDVPSSPGSSICSNIYNSPVEDNGNRAIDSTDSDLMIVGIREDVAAYKESILKYLIEQRDEAAKLQFKEKVLSDVIDKRGMKVEGREEIKRSKTSKLDATSTTCITTEKDEAALRRLKSNNSVHPIASSISTSTIKRRIPRSSAPPRNYSPLKIITNSSSSDIFIDEKKRKSTRKSHNSREEKFEENQQVKGESKEIKLKKSSVEGIIQLIASKKEKLKSLMDKQPKPFISLPELKRRKSHWDFLLDEMQWLANDFYQERKWKRGLAKAFSYEASLKRNSEEIEQETEKQEIARQVSQKIRTFWRSIERIAARSRLRFPSQGQSQDEQQNIQEKHQEKSKEHEMDSPSTSSSTEVLDLAKQRLDDKDFDFDPSNRLKNKVLFYQAQALRWMVSLDQSDCNFLLADQFGCGRSAIVSAFLVIKDQRDGIPHLILSPSSELSKWVYWLGYWKKEDSKVQVYKGIATEKRQKHRDWVHAHYCVCSIDEYRKDMKIFREQEWNVLVVDEPLKHLISYEGWEDILLLKKIARKILVGDDLDKSRTKERSFLGNEQLVGSLKRLRNQVEDQLCKIEEQSVACSLTMSQANQYREILVNSSITAPLNHGKIAVWLRLMLSLRGICNCVELIGKIDKITHADLCHFESCSGKLARLGILLEKLLKVEKKRVVVYTQMGSCLELLEFYINQVGISTVRITGEDTLIHFALQTKVQVAISSTRSSCSCGHSSVVYGANAVIVFDSDWDPVVDAKLRASWQRLALVTNVVVYRLYCEGTVETSMLRYGSCITEKVFHEIYPRDLVRNLTTTTSSCNSSLNLLNLEQIPIERPKWWMQLTNKEILISAKEVGEYYNDTGNIFGVLASVLKGGVDDDLDELEDLLLSNTDELTPIEWYAMHYVDFIYKRNQHNHQFESLQEEKHSQPIDDEVQDNVETEEEEDFMQHTVVSDRFFYEKFSTQGIAEELCQLSLEGLVPDFSIYFPFPLVQAHPNTGDFFEQEPTKDGEIVQDWITSDDCIVDAPKKLGLNLVYKYSPPPLKPITVGVRGEILTADDSTIKPVKINNKKFQKEAARAIVDAARKRKAEDLDIFMLGADGLLDDKTLCILDNVPNLFDGNASTPQSKPKVQRSSLSKPRKAPFIGDVIKEVWSLSEDRILKQTVDTYGYNWNLISAVVNQSSLSPFSSRRHSSHQCRERYYKVHSSIPKEKSRSTTGRLSSNHNLLLIPSPEQISIPSLSTATYSPYRYIASSCVMSAHLSFETLWKESIREPLFPKCEEAEKKKHFLGVFGHILHAQRGKKTPPELPGKDHHQRLSPVLQSTSVGSFSKPGLNPLQVIERSKILLKETTKEMMMAPNREIASLTSEQQLPPNRNTATNTSSSTGSALLSSSTSRNSSPGRDIIVRNVNSSSSSHPVFKQRTSTAASSALVSPSTEQSIVTSTDSSIANNGMQVTPSTLLYVIDQLPEIKSQIQAVLQRQDCTEAQKVELIARLLKTTNQNQKNTKK